MKRKPIVIAALAALGILAAWLLLRDRGASEQAAAELSDDQIVAQRRTARRSGKVDVRPAAVVGRVVDADTDAPIAGAMVSIAERSLDGGARGRPGASPEPLTAITDAGGQFRVADLRPGRYSIAATAAGHAPAVVNPLDLTPGDERTGIVLRLSRGGQPLTGTVTDIGGGPVAGAFVRAKPQFEGSITAMFRAPFTTTTDDAGRYALQLADGGYEVSVRHADYVGKTADIEIRGAPRVENFKLVPGGVIEGMVVTVAGNEPVAGALVTEAQEELRVTGAAMGAEVAITDDEGRFTMRGLPSGEIQLQAIGRAVTTREPTLVALGIGEHVVDVVIYVDKAYTVSGFVVDKDDRSKAISGVVVGAYSLKPPALMLATDPSADDGYFEILGVPAGNYTVGAIGEQRLPTVIGPSISVEDRDIDDLVVEVVGGLTVSGRVDPPTAATIRLSFDAQSFGLNFAPMISAMLAQTRTDDTGQFELRGLARGQFTIEAEADDGREGKTPLTLADSNVTGIVVKLENRATVSGVVVDASGTPVANARVAIEPSGKKEEGFMLGAGMLRDGGALTHPDGSFEQRGVNAGTHEVSVEIDGQTLAWAGTQGDERTKPIEIEVKGTTPVTGLRLVVEARDKQIRGVVIGPDGAPAADAWVTARYWNPEPKKKPEQAEAEAEDGDTVSVTVTVGDSGSGASTERSDDPEREARRRRWAPSEQPVLSDADGRFAISGLRDGNYDVEAEGARGSARGRVESVRVGADVTIKMDALATVEGVVKRGGKPVDQYSVSLEPSSRTRAVANAEGRYQFGRIEPGSYTVQVTADDGRGAAKIEVKAAQKVIQDIDLVDYGSVTGVVLDARTAKPMSGYSVMAYSDGGDHTEMFSLFTGGGPKTDAEGRFRVGRLGAGEGALLVLDGDRNAMAPLAMKKFELGPGQTLDLGTIHGNPTGAVPREERGELGLTVTTATWKQRPGVRRGDTTEPPAGIADDTELLWVSEIDKDGAAEEAGLEVGDRILAVDGLDLASVGVEMGSQLLSSLRTRAGESRTVAYDRGGKQSTATVKARPLPAP